MFRKIFKSKTDMEIESITHNKDGSSGSSSSPELSSPYSFACAYYNAVNDERSFTRRKSDSDARRAEAIADYLKEYPDETDYEPWGFHDAPVSFEIMVTGRLNGQDNFEKSFANAKELKAFLLENKLTTEKKIHDVFAEDEQVATPGLR